MCFTLNNNKNNTLKKKPPLKQTASKLRNRPEYCFQWHANSIDNGIAAEHFKNAE